MSEHDASQAKIQAPSPMPTDGVEAITGLVPGELRNASHLYPLGTAFLHQNELPPCCGPFTYDPRGHVNSFVGDTPDDTQIIADLTAKLAAAEADKAELAAALKAHLYADCSRLSRIARKRAEAILAKVEAKAVPAPSDAATGTPGPLATNLEEP